MERKKYVLRLFALLALMLPWTMQAQNAKVSEYDGSSYTATYSSIVGTSGATAWSQGDYVDVTMPFAMHFGENQIASGSTLRVFPDGSVTFTGLEGSRIAPLYYSSGYTTTATSIYTKSTTSLVTVEWRKVVAGNNSYSFQLKLYSTGDIEFCYGPMTINSSISVLVGMMSSDNDIYRVGGADGGSSWDTIYRYTSGTSTRTLSSSYAPAFDINTGMGMVYNFTQPACVKPTSATATALAWNSIKVDWEVSSPGNGYEVKYSNDPNFDPSTQGQSKTVSGGSTLTTNITGLQGGTTYYIYVRKNCSGAVSGWSEMTSATTPTGCPYLSGISSTNATASSVTLYWRTSLAANGFNIRYNLGEDFDPNNEEGTLVSASDTSKTLTGLTGASTYYYYVRAICISGLTTDWYGPYTFNTQCGAITVNAANPYIQTFEDSNMPICWSEEVVSGSDHWTFNGNGQASFTYTPGSSSRLITPIFNLNPTGAYQVEFYHAEPDYSGGADSLWLCYRTSATGEWVRLAQYGSHSSTLEHVVVLLPNPTSTYQLAFISSSEDYLGMAIAYVVVRTQPTCPNPTALAVDSQTNSSVTLSWTEMGSANAWQIAYGQFTTDDDYVIVSANTNPFTVTGLTAEQTYHFFVRSYCASDDQSEWVGSVSATPSNAATLTVNDGTTTNEYVPVYGYWADNNSRSQFVIPASELTNMQWGQITKLTFYSSDASKSWGNAQFNVYMAPAASTTISALNNWNDLELVYSGSLSISNNVMEITLDNPYQYIGGNLLIGINQTVSGTYSRAYFYGVSATGASMGGYGTSISQRNFLPKTTFNYIAGEPVTCFKPNGLAVSDVTYTTATLTWNELGATTQWEVKYGPAGFDPFEEGVSMIVNTTPALALDYLESGTAYDVYVRSLCNPEGPTEWNGPVSFNTPVVTCLAYGAAGEEENHVMGTGTSTNTMLPCYNYYKYSFTEQIYSPAEVGGSGIINSIAFYNNTSEKTRTVDVYLVETDKVSFSGGTDWVPVGIENRVYSGSTTFSVGQWTVLTLSTPFNYSGTGNLLVVVDDNTGAYTSSPHAAFLVSDATSQALRVYSDGTDYNPATPTSYSGTVMNVKNNIQLGIQYAQCISWPFMAPQVAIALSDVEYAATLTFTNMNEDVTNPTYGMIWGPQGFNPATSGTTVSPISANTYTLSNLTQQTTYDVYVYAISSNGNSDTVRYGFTTPFIPNCKTPNTLAASNISYNTANITWNQPGDAPQFWTVRYAAADFNPATAAAADYTELTVQGTAGATAQLTGLVAGTTYYVYVKATCSTSPVDESPWSVVTNANPAFTFTTPACVTPTDVAAVNVTNSTATITWNEAGVATAWTVIYGQHGFDPATEGTAVSSTDTSKTLTGLDAYTYYDAYVMSNCTANDISELSNAVTFRTVCPDGGDIDIVGISEGTQYTIPVNTYYNYSYTQQIITADEIPSAGTIQGISLQYAHTAPLDPTKYDVTIYIGVTDKSSFASNTDFVDPATLTPVWHGTFNVEQGWNDFPFDVPFVYNGSDNIVIAFDDDLTGYNTSSHKFNTMTTENPMALTYYSDSQNPDASSASTLSAFTGTKNTYSYRNVMRLMSNCNSDVTCFAPASVSDTVAADNSVYVTWVPRTDLVPVVNNFELKYGLAGFNPDNQGTLVSNLNNVFHYNITADLNYNADYDVYVRTVCGDGDYSNWTKGTFHTYPSCWAPDSLMVLSTTSNSATLKWLETTPSPANRWEVVYGLEGFDPEFATPVETTNNTGFTVTGLKHTSRYEFYVRAVCSATDHSPWSAVATGTTQCGVWQYEDLPLTENFDSYTGNTNGTLANHVLPNCWSWMNGGSNSSYAGLPSIYSTSSYSYSTPNTLRFYAGSAATYADQYAVLPQFGFDLDTVDITLYGRFYNTSSSLQVGVMTDPEDAETFQLVQTLTAPSTGYNTQQPYSVSLSEYTGSGRYIAFKLAKPSSGTNAFYMDDLVVKLREKVNVLANNGGTKVICNEFVMPDTSNGGNYAGGLNATYVLRPAEAGKVAHITGTYDLENGYDFLNVYRGGVNVNNLVGRYTGKGSIDYVTTSNLWSDSGYVTLVFTTDADNAFTNTGFKLLVSCECPMTPADIVTEAIEANGTYTWRNGTTYVNNIVRTGLTYDAESVPMADPDKNETANWIYYNVAGCDSIYYGMELTLHPTYNLTYNAEICERDVFAFYGNNYDATGTYTVSLTSQYGADSTGILSLQRHPAPSAGIYYNNRLVTEVADYCDNADMILLARSNNTNATFVWDDQSTAAQRVVNPHESNSYSVVATETVYGCSSLPATLTVTTVPVADLSISGDNEICFGQSTTLTLTDANNVAATYRWNTGATGTSITVSPTETTTYTVTATTSNASACATSADFTVTVNPLPVVTATASVNQICRDSIVTLNATVVDGYSYSWNTGATTAEATVAATATGNYTVTVTDLNGCVNEFSTANVTVYPSYELESEMSVCYTQNPYTWEQMVITANGSYDQMLQTRTPGRPMQCDSLVHLTFTFEEMGVENSAIERCYGTTYTFENITRTATEDTALTYIDYSGECPVQYNLAVTVNPVKATTIENTVCDTYTWTLNNETYTQSGEYPVTLETTHGCDSVVTLNLTVNYQNTGVETVTACDNYVWDLNGVNYTATTNEPTFTLQNQWGCDSVVTLDLTVNYRSYHEEYHCVSDALTYTWTDGNVYNLDVALTDSIQYITGENELGCYEIALLHLNMNPVTDTLNWADIEVCDEYTLDIVNINDNCESVIETIYLRESGDYEYRTPNATAGHDQWTRIHLTVTPSSYHTTVAEECLPYTWTITREDGTPFEVATITEDMVAEQGNSQHFEMSVDLAEAGYVSASCSSIEVLKLTPKYPTTEITDVVTICANQSWTSDNGDVFLGSDYVTGEYTWDNSETNAAGCQLEKKVSLTVNPVYSETVNLTFCENEFTLNEETGKYELVLTDENHANQTVVLTIPGELNEEPYEDVAYAEWQTVNGCDSNVTINYIVNPTLYFDEYAEACYKYIWSLDGRTYSYENGAEQNPQYTETAENGCQLVTTLHLTLNDTIRGYVNNVVCTSYEYEGTTYRNDQTFYQYNGPVEGGCDSVTYINFHVAQSALNQQYVVSNRPYTWKNGQTYSQNVDGGVFYDVPVAEGCDSVLELHFTMVDAITFCDNAFPYQTNVNGIVITENDGTSVWSNNDPQGNDTILYYTVNPTYNNTLNETACDSYTWDGTVYTASDAYTNNYTSVNGCDSTVTLNLTINASTHDVFTAANCDSYTWENNGNTVTLTESGVYTSNYENALGCPSTDTLYLTINVNEGVTSTVAACQTYTWEVTGVNYVNNSDQPVVNTYTHQFADANGCLGDSVLTLTLNPVNETTSELIVNEDASYTYLGEMYLAPFDSTFTSTFQNQYGCDSIDHLHLVIPIVDQITVDTVEACNEYTWTIAGVEHTYQWIPMSERQSHGMAMYKDVTFNKYVYTYPTDTTFVDGVMVSVRVLHLNLLEATTSAETLNLPVSLGSYDVYNVIDGTIADTILFTYAQRGTTRTKTIGVGSVAFCDDFRTYTINFIDNYDTTEVFACADATSYTWNNVEYEIGTPGHTYWFVQKENEGTMNELVHVLKLNQRAVNAITVTETACDSHTWTDGNGQTYTESVSGVVYNYTDANGCAATKTLNLTVNYNTNAAFTAENCDRYTWSRNNQSYTTSGDYTYSYNATNGCPSVDTLHLTVKYNTNQGYTASGCVEYTWQRNNVTYEASGNYKYNYTAENGCPSVDTLHLTINMPTSNGTTMEVCDGVEWNDTWYNASGTYYHNYETAAGCASVDTLYLTVNFADYNSETLAACDSMLWNGTVYTVSSPAEGYIYTYTNQAGCPSADTLHLTINVNNTAVYDTITACDEYTWTVNNRLYNTSGDYTARLTDANGCVAVSTLNLTINNSNRYDSILYISDGSYRYYGENATELFGEGVYTRDEHYTNVAGCDSTLRITFNIGTGLLGVDNLVVCNQYTWRNDSTYMWISAEERASHLNDVGDAPLYKTVNGTYVYYNPTYTVPQENYFDSIYMLALTLTQSYNGYDEVTINISDRVVNYAPSTNEAGEVTYAATFNFDTLADLQQNFVSTDMEFDVHFPAVQFCDSIITLTVHLLNNYQEVTAEAADICVSQRSYTWRGHTVSTATNDYDNAHTYYVYDTLATGVIEYITVNQHPFAYATERRTACDQYEWNGTLYTESTSNATAYFQAGTVFNAGTDNEYTLVCDSTVTLILTINHNTNTTYDVAECETYTWLAADGGNGETYTESGVYTYDYFTDKGCPSTNTLNLTINYNTSTAYTVDECDEYIWNDVAYTESGDYTYEYETEAGCPSTDTLHLTIRTNSNQTFTVTDCDEYTWAEGGDNLTYTESGTYYFEYTAENECPSVNTLVLTINHNNGHIETVDNACDSYTWHGTVYTTSGEYTYDYADANNCASEDTLILTVNASTHNSETVVACQNYTWHGETISNTGATGALLQDVFTYDYLNEVGCPSTDTLHLTLGNGRTFSTQTVSNCGPYTWVVNDEEVAVLSESVETSTSFLNTRTGCDSVVFLYLTIFEAPMTDIAVSICDNELPYTWTNGDETRVLEAAGQATVTYPFSDNCDSTVRLTLTVNPTEVTNLTAQVCLGNGYTDNVFNIAASEMPAAGEYTFTEHLETEAGCDHTYNITITVGDVINNMVDAVVACDSYDWTAGDGQTYTYSATGSYTSEPYANADGCTTVDILDLTINQNAGTEYTVTYCDTYMWNGTSYTESGDYEYEYTDGNGCTSTDVLHLTIKNSVINTIEVTSCDKYVWENGTGDVYYTTGAYQYQYTAENGCNGLDVLVLTINNNTNTVYNVNACDEYIWNDVVYTESGDYTYEYETEAGCPSIDTLHLTMGYKSDVEETIAACESYTWYRTTYTESGDYYHEYLSNSGCPSTDVLHLTVNHNSSASYDVAECNGYDWNGVHYNVSGTYLYPYTSEEGCPSVDTLYLTINTAYVETSTITVCDSYYWDVTGETFTESTAATALLGTTVNGCDSTAIINVTIYNSDYNAESAVACNSYTWNGVEYTTSGVHVYNYNNANGCASADTLHLTINTPVSSTVTAESCSTYFWNGNLYNQSGTYTYTTTAANGCDSVVTLNLTVKSPVSNTINVTSCNSYTWNGQTYNLSGNYTGTFTAANGCDSVVTLSLVIAPASQMSFAATACDSYTWNNTNYTQSGTYTASYTTLSGCDSIVTLTLTINNSYSTSETATSCGSYTWNGNVYTASGNYPMTLTAANGCDSNVTLTLTVNQPKTTTLAASACGSYTWNNSTYTTSGVYTQTFTAANGCDSVVTLNLQIKQPVTSNLMATACDSYTWNNQTYDESGVYSQTFTAANNCDSIVTLNLTVNASASTTLATSVCNSFTWNGATYNTTGVYTQNFTTVNGCDSTVTLNLNIKPNVTNAINVTACNSYTWNDETYTQSGIHTYTYEAANGCDSVVTLSLTIAPAIQIVLEATACDSYTWAGETYTTSGNYSNTYTATSGCDSIVTLNLTINNSVETMIPQMACDYFIWEGATYTNDRTITHTYDNVNNCDSVVTIVLTVNHSVATAFTASACGSYTWNDSVYEATGAYTQTFTAENTCDSIVTLNLTINGSTSDSINVSACDSYTWINGETYTQSTLVTYTTTNTNGCDSVITLNLTINYSATGIEEVTECDGFAWIDGNTYTASTNTPTYTLQTRAGCDSVVTLHLTINHSIEEHQTLTISQNQLPYTWRGHEINAAGEYEFDGYTVKGCDSIVFLTVTVNQIGIDVVSNLDDLKVYPNPTRGQVTITADNVVKVEVLDIVGRLVATFNDTNTFDLSNLGEGAYTLRISLTDGTAIRKVVKK